MRGLPWLSPPLGWSIAGEGYKGEGSEGGECEGEGGGGGGVRGRVGY